MGSCCGLKNQTLARLAEAGAGGMIAMGTEALCPNKAHTDPSPWGRRLFAPNKAHTDQPPWQVQQQAPAPPGALALQVTPQPALPATISPHHPSSLPPTERFPLQLPMASQVPAVTCTLPAMPPPVSACMLPSVPGRPLSSQPAQLHPITGQLVQASVWHGVPGPLGPSGQLVQLPRGVQLPVGVQLPPVVQLPSLGQLPSGVQLPRGARLPAGVQPPRWVQLPHVPAPSPPAYGWGQHVVMGTLLPHQPRGLGPAAVVQGETLDPTGSCPLHLPARPGPPPPRRPAPQRWVHLGPAGLHTPPTSAHKPSVASNEDGAAIEDSIPAASPQQPTLAPPTGRTTPKPNGEFSGVAELTAGRPS